MIREWWRRRQERKQREIEAQYRAIKRANEEGFDRMLDAALARREQRQAGRER